MIALLLLAGCAWAPARVLGDTERADVFAIEGHGRVMAGTALVAAKDGAVTLHAITPTGTDLFEVRVDASGATVEAADPDLAGWLARLPFERDLTALYRVTCDVDRCRFGAFRLVRRTSGWALRGPGGPAVLTVEGGAFRLEDARRGYVLRVVPAEGAR